MTVLLICFGNTSILARKYCFGACAIWSMDSESTSSVTFAKDSSIKLIGSGDFGGDSTPDIVEI